jgi:hypothetical protein
VRFVTFTTNEHRWTLFKERFLWILMVLFCRTHLQNGSWHIHISFLLGKCEMIKKPVYTLNILSISMHISNVCDCNKYLLGEYECIYTNIHEGTCIHTLNLRNICCVPTGYKLRLKSDENKKDKILFRF